jgi:PIN domain nuclease of toxin-antitoxin system
MILLDTHVLVWWVHGDRRLTPTQAQVVSDNEADRIGVSAISCWEVAKLVEYGRLELPCELHEWFNQALGYPAVQLLALTPEIAIESTRLPGQFPHRDPADQIIVATARIHGIPLLTADEKLLAYPLVRTIR